MSGAVVDEERLRQARELLRVAERRTAPGRTGTEHEGSTLPVAPPLARLLPRGGLARGGVVALVAEPVGARGAAPARPEHRRGARPASSRPVSPRRGERPGGRTATGAGRAAGVTSLLWALLAEASAAGAWIGVAGCPALGPVAAAEAGVRLERLALVPEPGVDLVAVTSALLDGLDVVVATRATGAVTSAQRDQLAARARHRGAVLVTLGAWPGADLVLSHGEPAWAGIGPRGSGRLRERELSVRVHGRGLAPAGRSARLRWLLRDGVPILMEAPGIPGMGSGPARAGAAAGGHAAARVAG